MLLIDGSNFIFHRWFAIDVWLKMTQKARSDFTEQEMLDRFAKSFETTLLELKKKFAKTAPWTDVIFAKDCRRDAIWRMKLFSSYKEQRVCDAENDKGVPAAFAYTFAVILPALQQKYPGLRVIGCPAAEADDVIAIVHSCVRTGQRAGTPATNPITIVSTDLDYVQICDRYTALVNANKKDMLAKFDTETRTHYLEVKVIKGDKSDNIPPIAKKIGDKTAIKYAKDKSLLEARFAQDEGVRLNYERNRTLIDFKCIPNNIRDSVCSVFLTI